MLHDIFKMMHTVESLGLQDQILLKKKIQKDTFFAHGRRNTVPRCLPEEAEEQSPEGQDPNGTKWVTSQNKNQPVGQCKRRALC